MPVTDMMRIDDAPKRIHELHPEGTSESAQNARRDDSRTNKLKSIFLRVGIFLCVICGSANQSKAQSTTLSTSSTPSNPNYDSFNEESQSFFNSYDINPYNTNAQDGLSWYYFYMGYMYYYYYLANYSGDWYGFNGDTLGNHSDQHLSATSFNPSTASAYWYNYYAYEGDLSYQCAQAAYRSLSGHE
jgi:hypothetical protein